MFVVVPCVIAEGETFSGIITTSAFESGRCESCSFRVPFVCGISKVRLQCKGDDP